MGIAKKNKRFEARLIVEWDDEDKIFIGRCPKLFYGGVHGDDEWEVFKELCQVLNEVIEIYEENGDKSLIKDAMKLSEKSFNKVWKNNEDAVYDKI